MVMSFSLMAVTAAAYGAEEHEHTHVCSTETIQPRKPGAPQCIYCGQAMTDVGAGKDQIGPFTLYECMNPDCNSHYSIPVYR